MARSLARTDSRDPVAAAATLWLALGVALAVPVTPPPRAPWIPPVAAHGPALVEAWHGVHRVYEVLDRRARGLDAEERARIARTIIEEAARADLAPALVLAVIEVESAFDVRAVSPVGAVGLMQLMVPTLREELALAQLAAHDPFEPVANVRAGVRYLGRLVGAFPDLELALMAYNAGPNRIRRHLGAGGVPERFRGYPRDVLRRVEQLGSSHAAPRPPTVRAAAAVAHAPPAAGAPVPAAPHAHADTPCRDACVRLEPALPMSRGRDRPRPLERPLPG